MPDGLESFQVVDGDVWDPEAVNQLVYRHKVIFIFLQGALPISLCSDLDEAMTTLL